MRVAIVSTYPPAECGIGNYTRELFTALAKQTSLDVTVLAERVTRPAADAPGVVRCWHRRGPWSAELMTAIEALRPDHVHLQHEEAILGQGRRMIGFVRALRARGIAVSVTLHSVYANLWGRWFHRKLAATGARFITHQRTGMADVLIAQGVPLEQLSVIAHGTPVLAAHEQARARLDLGLDLEGPLALFFGFIHPKKSVHVAVEAFERIAPRVPRARLVIAGRIRERTFLDALYARKLRRLMRDGLAARRIVFRPGFASVEDRARYFSAADVLVLPHRQAYGSASGVLHEAFASRRAFVCTRGKKFAEAVEALAVIVPEAFPPAGDVDAWANGLELLLGSEAHRVRMGQHVDKLARATGWASSAALHATHYAGQSVDGNSPLFAVEA